MRTIAIAVTGLAVLAFSMGVAAQPAGNTGFYIGAGMGKSKAAFVKNDFTLNLSTVSESDTSRETAYKFFAGYKFSKYIGLEGSWMRFGEFKYKYNATSIGLGTGESEYSVDSWGLSAIATIPVGAGFSLLGRVGGAYNNVQRKAVTGDFVVTNMPSAEAKTSSVLWGLGAEYDISNTVGLRLEYEDYGKVGKANPHPPFPGNPPFPETGQAKLSVLSLSIIGRF